MFPGKPLPQLSIDPFSDESLADPYAHHDLLRGAGPVFWLECHGIYGAARHAVVSTALKDWQPTFLFENILGFEDSCLMLNVKAQLFEFARRYRIVPGAVERRNPRGRRG
jgi:hypothetical protein